MNKKKEQFDKEMIEDWLDNDSHCGRLPAKFNFNDLILIGELLNPRIKTFISQIKANQRKDFKKLITKEIVSAQKEGQPTSRLTRLYKKL